MGFSVRPEAVRETGRAMDVLTRASAEAVRYCAHTRPEASGGSAFVRLVNSTALVQPTAEGLFAHLERIAERSADELIATARYYVDTDRDAAAASDRTIDRVRAAEDGAIPR